MFSLKKRNFVIRDAGQEMKQTEIKPNFIYEIEAMRMDAEEERVKKYSSMIKYSAMYNRTCKWISMINID